MNSRSITLLALLTAGVLVLAGIAMLARRSGAPAPAAELLPAFRAQLNDASAVTIRQGGRTATLHLEGDTWRVREKGGYPAKFADIKALLVTLADLEGVEPKTDRPDLYARIGVEDPAPGNDATLVTVADGTGAAIASVIVGDSSLAGSSDGRFVRVAGQAQSWLVNAVINAPADSLAWVDREIIRLDAAQVALVRTERDGDTLAIVRGPDGSLSVEGLPEDRVPKGASELRRFTNALALLSLTDVEALDEGAVPEDALTTTFTRADGVSLVVRSWETGERHWIAIGVSRPAGAELTEEARLQADDYEQRFGAWRFAIDELRFNQLRPTVEDLSTASSEPGPPSE